MPLYTLQEMAKQTGAIYKGPDLTFQGLSIDSRTIVPGECFLCLKGPHFDGHHFAKQAVEKGASALITEYPLQLGVPEIIVQNSLQALGQLGQLWRSQFNIPVIAVTGSCGKTTTRNMIVSILSQIGSVVTSLHNYNNIYGLPLSLLRMRPHHQFAIFELGTSTPGEILAVTTLCEPTIAVITNVRGSHLDGLGSIEGVSQEKSDIFLGLRNQGIAILNLDEPFHHNWMSKIGTHQTITFSTLAKADVTAHKIHITHQGAAFELHTTLGPCSITIPLLGEHVIPNALAAISCTLAAGAQLPEIQKALSTMTAVVGRLEPIMLANGALLINDSYNAIAAAVENSIKLLGLYTGKKILVMSHMVELGDYKIEYHTKLGQWTKAHHIDHVLLVGDETLLQHTLAAAGPRASYFPTQEDLVDRLLQLIDDHSTILVKGAHSAKMNLVVNLLIKRVHHAIYNE